MILAVGLSCMAFIMLRSVQFSHSVVSHSLQPHGLQHASLLCPSPTPRAYPNSCLLSRWCHPTISSSVVPFSSHFQSCLASGSFQMSQFFASDGQSIGVSASASVIPMNIQDWFPLGWTGWISLLSKGLSRVFSNSIVQKHQFFGGWFSDWMGGPNCLDWAYTSGGWLEVTNLDWPRLASAGTLWTAQFRSFIICRLAEASFHVFRHMAQKQKHVRFLAACAQNWCAKAKANHMIKLRFKDGEMNISHSFVR